MSITVQNQMRAIDLSAQQKTAAAAQPQRLAPQEQTRSSDWAGAAYRVEISDAAREKYAAQQSGAQSSAAMPSLAHTNHPNAGAAGAANAAQEQPDEEEQAITALDEDANETAEEPTEKGGNPLEARLEKLRKKLSDVRRSVLPDEEKKAQVSELKRQIQTLETQLLAQQQQQKPQRA